MVKKHSLQCLQDAIDYIENHLDEKMTPADVSQHIGFSEFHFHRMFVSVLGESISAYSRRRRLTRAADALKSTDEPIMSIGLAAGFDSQQTFTRAFKQLFGQTPAGYRTEGGMFAIEKPKLTAQAIRHLAEGVVMEPKIVDYPGAQVVGVGRGFNPDTTGDIPALWDSFVAQCREQSLPTQHAFGVCIPEHPAIQKGPGETFVYVAGIPADVVPHPAPNMVRLELPSGRYAVFTHRGTIADFRHTVKWIWSTWIPEHRDQYREGPDFEWYDERFDPRTASGEVDIYIPIK